MIFSLQNLPDDYLQVVKHIDVLRNQLRYATSDKRHRWTGFLRRSTFARAIQGSNSIEGFNVTEADAVAAVDMEEPLDAATEAWTAVVGYRTAMSYILQLADDTYYEHNEGTLRSLHYMMVQHDLRANPGRWRPGAVWVRQEPSGETVYDGPDVKLVPGLISELIKSLNAKNDLPVMVRAALAHLNLVMIHPFSDGNGRMARALQTFVLAREGIIDPEFSSIEEYLGRNTPGYYAVLGEVGQGAWHPERDALPWIRFCLTAHYQQAETLLRRNSEIQRLWGRLEEELEIQRLNPRMIVALADAALGFRVRNSAYRKLAEVSDQVASKDLRALVEHDLLVPKGDKKWRYYIASERLRQARANSRDTRKMKTDPFEIVDELQASLRGLGLGASGS